MGRTSKKVEAPAAVDIAEDVSATQPQATEAPAAVKTNKVTASDIPANVDALMRLYPQYEAFWVTAKGFVHPAESPEYLRKGATLYKNKYYKNT